MSSAYAHSVERNMRALRRFAVVVVMHGTFRVFEAVLLREREFRNTMIRFNIAQMRAFRRSPVGRSKRIDAGIRRLKADLAARNELAEGLREVRAMIRAEAAQLNVTLEARDGLSGGLESADAALDRLDVARTGAVE